MNGEARRSIDVPLHPNYNPPGSSGSTLGSAGAQIFGNGFAGRPIRGMEKEYGKRVVTNDSGLVTKPMESNPMHNEYGNFGDRTPLNPQQQN
jgi:hypothetical protein